jgi:iron(III) transport system permease protein
MPAGVLLAVVLERTDLPGRRLFSVLLLGTLFVPLPLFASAWQVVLGLARDYSLGDWAPWSQGLGSAAWIHAMAGLPWVVLLTSLGLRNVEPDLEEDARLHLSAAGVLWRISLPRCSASIAAALLWVALQTGTEITVTDLMQVRTAAEEVYTQFVLPDPVEGADALTRAVAASVAQVLLSVLLLVVLLANLDYRLPLARLQMRPAIILTLRGWRIPLAVFFGLVVLSLTAVPMGGLLWRAGLAGSPPAWSLGSLGRQLRQTWMVDGGNIVVTLAVSAIAGASCGALAVLGCWLARESRWFRVFLFVLLAIAWSMPGPIVGLGLKGVFRALLDTVGWPELQEQGTARSAVAFLLWYGPSYLPLLFVYVIRLLPFAVALLYPMMHQMPRELLETARLDGAAPRQELTAIVAPFPWPGCLMASFAVAVLSLGELSAGKMVSTPGAESYAEMLFSQMHYGVTSDLAARCVLLVAVALLASAILYRFIRR